MDIQREDADIKITETVVFLITPRVQSQENRCRTIRSVHGVRIYARTVRGEDCYGLDHLMFVAVDASKTMHCLRQWLVIPIDVCHGGNFCVQYSISRTSVQAVIQYFRRARDEAIKDSGASPSCRHPHQRVIDRDHNVGSPAGSFGTQSC